MASNQTANFGLNQWEATDKVLREEFNADNRKIEAAILALKKTPNCVTGTYTGTGVHPRVVEVGFKPSFVFILSQHSTNQNGDVMAYMGFNGYALMIQRSGASKLRQTCTFTETGFSLNELGNGSMNANGTPYYYAAFY